MNHVVVAHTPLAPSALKFRLLAGEETLSSLYQFAVEFIADTASLDMNQLLGQPVTLEIQTHPGGTRWLGGQVVRCELTGRETHTPRSYVYTATLRPWLWYLTRTTDCRIFQNKNVRDIIGEVLTPYGFPFEFRLGAHYREWEYCVQYQESHFDFISRLMEQEGMYYYFEHAPGQQTLILADDLSAHANLPDYAVLPYLAPDRLVLPDEEGIDSWQSAVEIRSGGYAVDDYDFKKPKANLGQVRNQQLIDGLHGQYQKYIWHGGYIDADQGLHYARVRLEEEQAEHARVRAHTKIRGIAPGYLFTLKHCPRRSENREYLVVGVNYHFQEGGYATGSSDSFYDFHFVVQPSDIPYRAPCITPVPRATGPQTAVVVGPPGQEIWTDRYARVKLQFRWDRYGQSNENSSCWVRVSDSWAGTNFGGIYIPRIGQEVVVDFLNGELDRPLITGRIYNADQMPPFGLPESATQSGFVTRTPGGTAANANILRFEDKKGAEQVKLHAERNYDISVEHDATKSVANKYLLQVGFLQLPPESQQSPLPRMNQVLPGAVTAGSQQHQPHTAGTPVIPMPAQFQQQTPGDLVQAFAQNITSAIQYVASAIGDASAKVYGVTVEGLAATVIFGEDFSVVTGDTSGFINGNQLTEVNGNNTTLVVGDNFSTIIGNHLSNVEGNSTSNVIGNNLSHVGGNSESIVDANTLSVVGVNSSSEIGNDSTSQIGANASTFIGADSLTEVAGNNTSLIAVNSLSVVGAAQESIVPQTMTINGSAVSVVGSSVSTTGSAISMTGSSMANTGSSVANTGSSVSSTGSSIASTGFAQSNTGMQLSVVGMQITIVGQSITL